MTPDEFLRRVLLTVDELAFRLSHTPHDCQEQWLSGFAERTRAQWSALFAPHLIPAQVAGMVRDLVERVRKRRDEIETAGVGTA